MVHRIVMLAGCAIALVAGAACGDSGDGSSTASPMSVASTPSPAATNTAVATATSPAPAGTQPDTAAPTATTAPQQSEGAPPLPTAVRATPTSPPPPPPPPPPAEQSLTVVAKDVKFAPSSLTARAGGVLHLTLDNQDAGVPHDIIVYDASGAAVVGTDPANGPVQQTLTVTLGAPGRYAFKCSVHPTTMNGVLSVQ